MAFSNLVLGVPAFLTDQVQQQLLERAFHDGLFPKLLFRQEAMFEPFQANIGTEIYQVRPGLLPAVTTPLRAGADPLPSEFTFEQWAVTINQYAGRKDVDMPTSAVANSNLFIRSIHQLGLQAGQSLNRLPRNALYKPYLSGQTVLTAAVGASSATTIHVASLNGFRDVIINTTSARPTPVSTLRPLPITIYDGATARTNTVIGYLPDNANDEDGPGTLLLGAQVGGTPAVRSSIISAYAPSIYRAGAGTNVDAISAGDTLVIQDFVNAANILRSHNVDPHEDGTYHAHIDPRVVSQLFADTAWQRLFTAQPDHPVYLEGEIGQIAGIKLFNNNEVPKRSNTGLLTGTGTNAFYASDVGAEVVNESGVEIARTIITGKGCMYEFGLDESNYVSEAGLNGKIGEFNVVNNGVAVDVDRVRLILAAPIDALQQKVRCSWSITAGWAVPSDQTAPSGVQRYKRAYVLESAVSNA
jgi:hypothetical protein